MDLCDFLKNALIANIPTLITGTVAITGTVLLYLTATKERRMKKVEHLQKQLESFYYPFALRLKQNTEIRKLFGKIYADDFRILTELLKGVEFEGNDKILLNEIRKNDEELNKLILSNQAIVSSELSGDLALLSSHYTLFLLACDGKLSSETERFKSHVHPNEVISKIEERIKKIEKQIERLSK